MNVPVEVVIVLVVSGILFTWMTMTIIGKTSIRRRSVGQIEDLETGRVVEVAFMVCVTDEDDEGSHQIRVTGRMDCAPHVAAYLACIAIQNSDEGVEGTFQKIQDEALAMARSERGGGA